MLSYSSSRPSTRPIALLLLLLLPSGAYSLACDLGVNSSESNVLLISCGGTEFNVTVTAGDSISSNISDPVCFGQTGEIEEGNDLLLDLISLTSGAQCTILECGGVPSSRVASDDYKFARVSSSCFGDINECSEHDCEICVNTFGGFQCNCSVGYSQNGTSCVDINECLQPDACSMHRLANSSCINTPGSFKCKCSDGFYEDWSKNRCSEIVVGQHYFFNLSCVGPNISYDIDENGTMTVEDNGFSFGYICRNSTGYEVASAYHHSRLSINTPDYIDNTFENGTECNFYGMYNYFSPYEITSFLVNASCYPDHDECEERNNSCSGDNVLCKNTLGSFECVCMDGYIWDESGSNCEDENECMARTPNVCNLDTEHCVNTIGSFDCFCNDGYNRTDGECTDIDECKTGQDMCGQNSTCQNIVGNYTCDCDEGFTGDGKVNCIDENECMSQTLNDCNLDTEHCVNTIGSFDCFCKDGYNRTNGDRQCTDIDECKAGQDMCGQNSTCNNTDGNYTCDCDEGFTGDGKVKCIEPPAGPLQFIVSGVISVLIVILLLTFAIVITIWVLRRNIRRKATNYKLHKHYLHIFGSHWKEPVDSAFKPVDIERGLASLSKSSSITTNIDSLWYENDISEVTSLSPKTPTKISTAALKSSENAGKDTADVNQTALENGHVKAEEVPVLTQPRMTKRTHTHNREAKHSHVEVAVPVVARAGKISSGYIGENVESTGGYVSEYSATTPEQKGPISSLTNAPPIARATPPTSEVPQTPSISQHLDLASPSSDGYIQSSSPVSAQQHGYVADHTVTVGSAPVPFQDAVPVVAGAKEWNDSNCAHEKVGSSGYVSENGTSLSEKVEATMNSPTAAPSFQLSHPHPSLPTLSRQSSPSGYVENVPPVTVQKGYTYDCSLPLSSTPPLIESHDSGCLQDHAQNTPPVTVQDGYICDPTPHMASDSPFAEPYDCSLPLSSTPPLIESQDSGCLQDHVENIPPVTGYVCNRTIVSGAKEWNDSNCVHEKVGNSGYVSENSTSVSKKVEATMNSLTTDQLSHTHPSLPTLSRQSSPSGYVENVTPVTVQKGYTYDCSLPLSSTPSLIESHDSGCLQDYVPNIPPVTGYVYGHTLPVASDSLLAEPLDSGCTQKVDKPSPSLEILDASGYMPRPVDPPSSHEERTASFHINSDKRKSPDAVEIDAYVQGPSYAAPLHVDRHSKVDDQLQVNTSAVPTQAAISDDYILPVTDATSHLEPLKNSLPVAVVQQSGYVTAESSALPQHVSVESDSNSSGSYLQTHKVDLEARSYLGHSSGDVSPVSSGYVRADFMSDDHSETDCGYMHSSAFLNSSPSSKLPSTGSSYVPCLLIEDESTVFNDQPETYSSSFDAQHQTSDGYITAGLSSRKCVSPPEFPPAHPLPASSTGYIGEDFFPTRTDPHNMQMTKTTQFCTDKQDFDRNGYV